MLVYVFKSIVQILLSLMFVLMIQGLSDLNCKPVFEMVYDYGV